MQMNLDERIADTLREIRDLHQEDLDLRRVMLTEQRAFQQDTQRALRKQQITSWVIFGVFAVLLVARPGAMWFLASLLGDVLRR
jgi:hypothetical protein